MAEPIEGIRVAFVGKLGGANLREARRLVREAGGIAVEDFSNADWLVIGEAELPLSESESLLQPELLAAADRGEIRVLPETEFWQVIGRLESAPEQRRYTPAMLADLLQVPISVVRRWQRRGLLVPVEVVHRLPYFDFAQVVTAKQLAKLLDSGISPQRLEKQLQQLGQFLPAARKSLDQLSVMVDQGRVLMRGTIGLLGTDGQWQFDFERAAGEPLTPDEAPSSHPLPHEGGGEAERAVDYRRRAWELEDENELEEAVLWYRAAIAAEGLQADLCFQLAEVLYRLGDLGGARERYYVAIELAPDFVEARANLGCVLAESEQWELAAAAFEGALETHPDYADVHYHLADVYAHLGRREEARSHLEEFLRLVPSGPWSEEAERRLRGLVDESNADESI